MHFPQRGHFRICISHYCGGNLGYAYLHKHVEEYHEVFLVVALHQARPRRRLRRRRGRLHSDIHKTCMREYISACARGTRSAAASLSACPCIRIRTRRMGGAFGYA